MIFGASSLVKCSASQLLYRNLFPDRCKVSKKQIEMMRLGNEHSEKIVSKNKALFEKRGKFITPNNNIIYFCIDMVKSNMFTEIKMVTPPVENWYLEKSILQSCLYATLLKNVKELDTPKFLIDKGFSNDIINIEDKFKYRLLFGKDRFIIYKKDNMNIREHYLEKADLIQSCIKNRDFDKCKAWDLEFKHKEFNILKPKFKLIKK